MYCKWEREQTTLIPTVHSLVQCFLVHMARVWGYWSIESLLCFSLADKLLKKVEYLEKNAKVYRGMSYVILLSHLPTSSSWLLVYTILQAIKTGGGRGLGMRICVMCYSSTCNSCQCISSNNQILLDSFSLAVILVPLAPVNKEFFKLLFCWLTLQLQWSQ